MSCIIQSEFADLLTFKPLKLFLCSSITFPHLVRAIWCLSHKASAEVSKVNLQLLQWQPYITGCSLQQQAYVLRSATDYYVHFILSYNCRFKLWVQNIMNNILYVTKYTQYHIDFSIIFFSKCLLKNTQICVVT